MSRPQSLKKIIETQLSIAEQKELLFFLRNSLRLSSGRELAYTEDQKDTLINFGQFSDEDIDKIFEFIQSLKKR